MTRTFRIRVRRYDPDRVPPAYTQDYTVEYRDNMTLLEALEEIRNLHDSTLAFRSSCRIAKCGSCGVNLNGRPALACHTGLDGQDIEVAPLGNAPVVKDLIVDRQRPVEEQVQAIEAVRKAPGRVAVAAPPPALFDYGNLSRCIGCLVCEGACPVVSVQPGDAFPGPSWLPTALGSGVGIAEERAAGAFHCLLCGACAVACPSGVLPDGALESARETAAGRGLLPQPLAALDERIATAYNISGEPNRDRLLWAANLARPPSGIGRKQVEAVYFVGCVSSLFPRSYSVAQSFVQILERAGLDYGLLGEEEWCCGYPMAVNGELERARALMRHNLDAVRATGARLLVTTCPSCLTFWKEVYPHILGEELGFRVLHATEYLAELLEDGRLPLRSAPETQVITYHDPCDLGRKGGIYDAPRRVLARLPGLALREMDGIREQSECCGGGGNLESLDPELGKAVAARRIRQAADTGAGTVVSACQQCERTLAAAARGERIRIRVKDIGEMVLEAMEPE